MIQLMTQLFAYTSAQSFECDPYGNPCFEFLLYDESSSEPVCMQFV